MGYLHTRLKAIIEEESKISIIEPYYYETPVGGRFIYHKGGAPKEIIISTELEAAQLLKKHGRIHTYIVHKDGSVVMKVLNSLKTDKTNAVWASSQTVRFHDFGFSQADVLRMAAVHEVELSEQECGLVVSMFTRHNKQAA